MLEHVVVKVLLLGPRGWNPKPHQVCIGCYRARRRQRRQQPSSDSQQAAMGSELVSQVSSVQAGARPGRRHGSHRRRRAPTSHGCVNRPAPIRLEHHIFSKGEWRRARLSDHPRALITISMDMPVGARPTELGYPPSRTLARKEFLACGFARDDLRPVSLSLSAANRSPIAIEGAFFARLSTTCSGGRVTSCRSMVYVSSSVRAMYLSYESLLNLSLLPVNFPSDDVAGGPKDRRSPDTADTPDQPLSVNARGQPTAAAWGQGIAQRPANRPRDSAMGASPPAPADEASPDLTVPTGSFLGAPLTVPQSPPALPQPTRPGRIYGLNQSKRYPFSLSPEINEEEDEERIYMI
ncbi:hypothetical protein F7725_009644 [Dissostichus mawsoni]|uniref:Uncharacterized protein n=1 Tax=Dissostichus mawsoni TaxID=36200 RepID=A0A7J5XL94_DISMA|nr:hypothetical protein F7725_009644 [Dissostichus mawsoni]